ncbi:DoxX family protein [Staphylococcus haemolyticus]|uniref:DoxX family protein n=2 Tax=Staphylococcus TaxID=1279 RepID=UPI00210B109D|nr:hypothetical protein [Staphylococcus haemolyticus]
MVNKLSKSLKNREDYEKYHRKIIFSLLFYKSGVSHFKNKDMFLKIVPSYLPFKHAIVKCSGILEFIIVFYVLGAKNRSRVRKVVQGFLWLVFPANIYAARKNISYKDERDRTDSVKQHVIRLPLQFVMVALAKLL